MSEKEQWINALRDNSSETIANIILADDERIKKQSKEIERLNNIINELKWKPINEYENPKYDWVLVKMFFKCDNFECIPRVAEKRFNHWYDANGYEIDEDMFEIKYFMDMQQIDKLYGLKGEYKKEVIKSERRIKDCF